MLKDQRTDSTRATRTGPGRRGGSSIRNEEAYIRETKARLGDEQALREPEARLRSGTTNPCSPEKGSCHPDLRWLILELLKIAEAAVLLGPDFRELAAAVTEQISGAEGCVTILDRLMSRVSDGQGLQIVRDYFDHQRESNEKLKSLLFGSATAQILAEHPLQRFRELATLVLGNAGYSYQEVAELVDKGDRDRTRKSPAWRAVLDECKRQGKPPPKKAAR